MSVIYYSLGSGLAQASWFCIRFLVLQSFIEILSSDAGVFACGGICERQDPLLVPSPLPRGGSSTRACSRPVGLWCKARSPCSQKYFSQLHTSHLPWLHKCRTSTMRGQGAAFLPHGCTHCCQVLLACEEEWLGCVVGCVGEEEGSRVSCGQHPLVLPSQSHRCPWVAAQTGTEPDRAKKEPILLL